MSRVVALATDLLRFASVTPRAGAALDYCTDFLSGLGFSTERLRRGPQDAQIDNLYATIGNPDNRFLFCGHLDVVPPGDLKAWRHDPFAALIEDGLLYGRGAVDMKGNIACFFAALEESLPTLDLSEEGIALLLTGDEEGEAMYGVRALAPELTERGERWMGCLTGEPTSQQNVGDALKHGRRGSLNGVLTIRGTQGHTGYPARADNAAHRMIDALAALRLVRLDEGNVDFEPSWLAITSVDVGNSAGNVIPAQATARLNYRFNTEQTSAGLREKTGHVIAEHVLQENYTLDWYSASEPYLSPAGAWSARIAQAIESITGLSPKGTTFGGTSDSRFLHGYCPVIDFGLCGRGMHEVNEAVPLSDLETLRAIYSALLTG